MSHRIFTISVGILTFALIALSVATATDQTANPPENSQSIEIVTQPDNARVGNIAQTGKEEIGQKAENAKDSAVHTEEMNQP